MKMGLQTAALTAFAGFVLVVPARADQCDAVASNLHTQMPEIIVGARTSDDRWTTIALNNPDVTELTISCANTEGQQPVTLSAVANATWPPSNFYDVVSSAGAVLLASTTSAIRSGSVLCAQRAMTADDKTAVFDSNSLRFRCTTTTGVGGSTRIQMSRLQEAPPKQQ